MQGKCGPTHGGLPPATGPDSSCTTGGHSTPRRKFSDSGDAEEVAGKAGIFFITGKVDFESMRFKAGAV